MPLESSPGILTMALSLRAQLLLPGPPSCTLQARECSRRPGSGDHISSLDVKWHRCDAKAPTEIFEKSLRWNLLKESNGKTSYLKREKAHQILRTTDRVSTFPRLLEVERKPFFSSSSSFFFAEVSLIWIRFFHYNFYFLIYFYFLKIYLF